MRSREKQETQICEDAVGIWVSTSMLKSRMKPPVDKECLGAKSSLEATAPKVLTPERGTAPVLRCFARQNQNCSVHRPPFSNLFPGRLLISQHCPSVSLQNSRQKRHYCKLRTAFGFTVVHASDVRALYYRAKLCPASPWLHLQESEHEVWSTGVSRVSWL